MRKIAKKIIPNYLWKKLGLFRRWWITRDDHKLTAREVFTRIYEKKIWGGDENQFSSGSGSHDSHVISPYIDAIIKWAEDNNGINKTALDIGCGDFHIGHRIYPSFGHYIAADIVNVLIESHQRNYTADNLEFKCIDAIADPLPEASVVFFRQVLQHLSNDEIRIIVPKLRKFKDVIVTEHLPSNNTATCYNLDKPHGGGIRLSQNSGIDLELPPFCISPTSSSILLEVNADNQREQDGIIRTTWYRFD